MGFVGAEMQARTRDWAGNLMRRSKVMEVANKCTLLLSTRTRLQIRRFVNRHLSDAPVCSYRLTILHRSRQRTASLSIALRQVVG